jgi:hypothetical protein
VTEPSGPTDDGQVNITKTGQKKRSSRSRAELEGSPPEDVAEGCTAQKDVASGDVDQVPIRVCAVDGRARGEDVAE